MNHRRAIVCAGAAGLIVFVQCAMASGQTSGKAEGTSEPSTAPDSAPASTAAPAPASDERAAAAMGESIASRAFGSKGAWWWSVTAQAAFADDSDDVGASLNAHLFLTDGFEFSVGLRGWGFFQDGEDEAGINPHIGFRWHFILEPVEQRYSIYADVGIGLLGATGDVPAGGTEFNFTPRAGVGATIRLGDSPARLDLGVGWHHISNASSFGSDDNPARDSIAIYAGVIFPF